MAGTSNLWSWVSTQMASRGPRRSPTRSSRRWGQSTTTSSACGKRRRVANTSRASHTVTRYPSTLAARTSALVKSTAPNTSIWGGGANDSMNTDTVCSRASPCSP